MTNLSTISAVVLVASKEHEVEHVSVELSWNPSDNRSLIRVRIPEFGIDKSFGSETLVHSLCMLGKLFAALFDHFRPGCGVCFAPESNRRPWFRSPNELFNI
jgi:hypothetical protein